MRRLSTKQDEITHLKAHVAQLEVENDQLINKLVGLSESTLDHERAIEHLNLLRLSCRKAVKYLNKLTLSTARDQATLRKALDSISSALLEIEE
jgi:hypothetical protein